MKAEELRIGNLLYDEILGACSVESIFRTGQIEVSAINSNPDGTESKRFFMFNERCLKPIPLTEECHNKLGVKKDGFNSFEYIVPKSNTFELTFIFHGDYLMLRQGKNRGIDDDIISLWNKDLTKRDMYVHEWQNLYFALTGKELIFTEQQSTVK